MPRILVVDDDPELSSNVSELLAEEGYELISASNGADAVALAKARAPDLVVCDIAMPRMDGYAVLTELRASRATSHLPFIFLSARAERNEVRAGMNLGADDYVTKPFQLQELLEAIRARLRRTSSLNALAQAAVRASGALIASDPEGTDPEPPSPGMVLIDPSMREIYRQLDAVAHSQLNVLVLGETGSGKEVLARALHDRSPRRTAPFLPLNCAALSEALLESELFGHEKGAFTGATQSRPGLFETAHGGSVFLDEVGELSPSIQTKLLRVLEDRKITRVGGRSAREVDVRFIAATNRNLKRAIAERTFREDLFYRLNGMSFTLPPLRARPSEIRPLCRVFATRACIEHGRPPGVTLSERALRLLERHDWPGNVRELKNVIERAVVLCSGSELGPEHLPPELTERDESQEPPGPRSAEPETVAPAAAAAAEVANAEADRDEGARLRQAIADLERQRVLAALEQSGGNQSLAAERLGMSRRSLVYRLSAFGLTRSRRRG